MHVSKQVRASMVEQAEDSYLTLMHHLELLLDATEFYLERYPITDASSRVKSLQLGETIGLLGQLPRPIAEAIQNWKLDQPSTLTALGLELTVLNELWCNVEALVYFFISEKIDLQPFSYGEAQAAHLMLLRISRVLS